MSLLLPPVTAAAVRYCSIFVHSWKDAFCQKPHRPVTDNKLQFANISLFPVSLFFCTNVSFPPFKSMRVCVFVSFFVVHSIERKKSIRAALLLLFFIRNALSAKYATLFHIYRCLAGLAHALPKNKNNNSSSKVDTVKNTYFAYV